MLEEVITYPCGCENQRVSPYGCLRSVSKCDWHRGRMREVGSLAEDYYKELGTLAGTNHAAELVDALGPLPQGEGRTMLEVGCGVSNYVKLVQEAGWSYVGLDPSSWAAQRVIDTHYVPCLVGTWEDFDPKGRRIDAILSAHSLEHMHDAQAAVGKMFSTLPLGGLLLLVIPDDEDQTNPDHLWFFSDSSIRSLLERTGFTVEQVEVKRRVKHECFIYVRATKRVP